MNLYKKLNNSEKEILNKLEVIEDKNYDSEDIRRLQNKIVEDIMSNSKNNIAKVRDQYSSILNKL